MELTKEQLIFIDDYLTACKVKFEDVRKELVDHFASILETKLQENPKLDFQQELQQIHKTFGENGFKNLLESKTKSVRKQFYKSTFQEMKCFFTIPKILIIVLFSLVLWQIMEFVIDISTFFNILSGVLIFLGFRLLFLINIRNSTKRHFLALEITEHFFNSFYVCVMIFNFFVRFDNESFQNSFFTIPFLAVFIILILFYCCGEFVFYRKKKTLMDLYKIEKV
jgi:hypothetical protein